MKLRNKLIISYFITGLIPLLLIGIIILIYVNKILFNGVYEFYQGQLFQVNSIINTLISDVMLDIENLSNNKDVANRNDKNFTNFLNADENTFKYNIGKDEQKIIDIFYSYLITHPYINSVYMGRENGSFVRSHSRPRPTRYDPRERPWYKLAKENPDKVMRTEPYLSVTSDDVNIGIVKALIDKNKKVFGVVGADITLERLANFVANIKLLKGKFVIIINKDGKILVHPDKRLLFKDYCELKIKDKKNIMEKEKGYTILNENGEKNLLFFYTSKENDWKICSVISEKIITTHIKITSIIILSGIIFIAVIFIFISLIMADKLYSPFNKFIKAMDELVDNIKNRASYNSINIKTGDEIEKLADSFNLMVHKLKEAYDKLDDNYKRIMELDKLKTSFISLVSHELRTPLTMIKGSVALLKKEKNIVAKPSNSELIEMMNKNINRLQLIIDDLLDISKIETGIFPVNKTEENIISVLNKIISEFMPFARNKKIKIIKKYTKKYIKWNFDKSRMIRVLDNIMSNAIKFSPGNSCIEANLKVIKGSEVKIPDYVKGNIVAEKNYLMISIKDEGAGIEKKYLEKIFDKFFQVEEPLTRTKGGAGIGLSIARAIVEAHNGIIWCESEGINKGSIFYILLPE